MRPTILALLTTAALAAGCGGETKPIIERDTGAVTSPGTTQAYERGGADGSGADGKLGSEDPQDRGGIGAGPDSSGERE